MAVQSEKGEFHDGYKIGAFCHQSYDCRNLFQLRFP